MIFHLIPMALAMTDALHSATPRGNEPALPTGARPTLYDRSFLARPDPIYDATPLHAVDPPFVMTGDPVIGPRGQRMAWAPPAKRGTKPGKRFAGNSDTEIGMISRPDPRRSVLCRAVAKCGTRSRPQAAMKHTTRFLMPAFEPTCIDEDAGRSPHPDHTA